MRCNFCGGTRQFGFDGGGPDINFSPITINPLVCPECQAIASRGGFKVWQIVVAIFFFPMGLLALLAPRNPNMCPECGHKWQG
jgi:hypothetical protein